MHILYLYIIQEVYWRIPASMTPAQLNRAADSLRPSSILDNRDVELESENEEMKCNGDVEPESENEESEQDGGMEPESENEESERDGGVERESDNEESERDKDADSEVDKEQDQEKVVRSESHGGRQSESECELVIDYGG